MRVRAFCLLLCVLPLTTAASLRPRTRLMALRGGAADLPRDAAGGRRWPPTWVINPPPWLQTIHRVDKATEIGWRYWCAFSLPACGAAMIGLGVMATRDAASKALFTECAQAVRVWIVTYVVPLVAIVALTNFVLSATLSMATGRVSPSEAARVFLRILMPPMPTLVRNLQWAAGAFTGVTAVTMVAAVFGTGAGRTVILSMLILVQLTVTTSKVARTCARDACARCAA